jgi:serine/threonine-protein kinase
MGSQGPPSATAEGGPQPPSEAATCELPPRDGGAGRRASDCPACGTIFSGAAQFCPFDGEPLRLLPEWRPDGDPLVGSELAGRYRIEALLGDGGMGKVYAARHVAIDRPCAIKVLRRELAQERETVERFLQEARVTAGLAHPGIVAVTDFGELEVAARAGVRQPWFVMELLAGESLAQRLRRERPLDPREVAAIGRECADALACAHDRGVVHRDLKPDNVFLVRRDDGTQRVVLLDFGVAQVASGSRRTRRGMTFGTPHYMSPEQATAGTLDGRSDLYALGVILYECLAGEVPFAADTFMGVLTKHVVAAPEPLERRVDPARLGELGAIVARCLEKSPAARHASAAQLAAELARAERAADGGAPRPDRRGVAPGNGSDPRLARLRRDEVFARAPFDRELPRVDGGRRRRARIAAIGVLAAAAIVGLGAAARGVLAGRGDERPVDEARIAPSAGANDGRAASAPVAVEPPRIEPASSTSAVAAPLTPGATPAAPGAAAATSAPRSSTPPPPAPAASPRERPRRPTRGTGEVKDPWAD